jgi:NAD(P)-dependent dehydrogenase (short-subunit alcohol dehydrogenase family)
MDGKVVVITGANAGIGKETAKDLARRGAKVIMACRNQKTAHEAREEIIRETNNEKVFVTKLDLSSRKSVRECAADISKMVEVIDVLIHNAGICLGLKKYQSVDGIEMTFATNHYGPFLLTHLLIDLVKKAKQGRIVVVASKNHHMAPLNIDNLNPINFPLPLHLYSVTKSANILFTVELAKRLKGTNVTVNCLHPGVIDTGIFNLLPFPLSLVRMVFRTTVEGAQTTIYLACAPELENVTGKYFKSCKEDVPNRRAVDEKVASKLWEESVKMVKLSKSDPKI